MNLSQTRQDLTVKRDYYRSVLDSDMSRSAQIAAQAQIDLLSFTIGKLQVAEDAIAIAETLVFECESWTK
jgi:hypothetical protein